MRDGCWVSGKVAGMEDSKADWRGQPWEKPLEKKVVVAMGSRTVYLMAVVLAVKLVHLMAAMSAGILAAEKGNWMVDQMVGSSVK